MKDLVLKIAHSHKENHYAVNCNEMEFLFHKQLPLEQVMYYVKKEIKK